MNHLFFKVVFCVACFVLSQSILAQQRPNIILILADDLGYGDTHPYGQDIIRTPNIDRLAREGMLFTDFYAGTSVCAPSRASLISGMHTGHTYIRGNLEIEPEGQEPIPDAVFTIAELLKKAKYNTAAFGKWGLGPVGSSGDPLRQGFDRFYGYNSQLESHRFYPTHLWDNDRRIDLRENGNLRYKAVYAADLIQQQALDWLGRQQAKAPFFAYLAYTLPHAELAVPEDSILQIYKGKIAEKPFTRGNDYGDSAQVGGYANQPFAHDTFAAMVTRLDTYVGQVLALLREKGLDKNTVVIFTSDNGPHREGGADPAFFNGSGGLRGIKRDLYEGGIREPFIVRWPGKIKAGSRNGFAGAFWDMLPTFAALANIQGTVATDGLSLLPTLTGKGTQQQHAFLYWEFHENGGRQAVRQENWKAVRLYVDKGPEQPVELYDLKKDPSEKNNIADQYPAKAKELGNIMDASHVRSALFPFKYEK